MNASAKTPDITTSWLNINTGCNNRCVHCYRAPDLAAPSRSMPLARARNVVDFFSRLGVHSCIFIGGEPTLYTGLPNLISWAKEKGIPEVTIVTNGRRLANEKYCLTLAESGLDVFSVSVHSAQSRVHNDITQNNTWMQTVDGIKNAVSTGRTCSLNLVANERNFESTPDSLREMLTWGVSSIVVSCATPCITDGAIDGTFALDPRRYAQLVAEIADIDGPVEILHELPLCLFSEEQLLRLTGRAKLAFGCHVGIGQGLSVDVDGSIIPCNSFPGCTMLELFKGDEILYTVPEFREIWVHDITVRAVRDGFSVYRSPICASCELWQICTCGCPLTWGPRDPGEYINDGLIGVRPDQLVSLTGTHKPADEGGDDE